MAEIINILSFVFIIFIFVILSFFEKDFKFETKKRIILFLIFLTSVVGSFRVVGADLQNYRIIFEHSPVITLSNFFENMFSYNYEPLFIIIVSLLKQLGLGFKAFLFIFLFIPLFIIYKIIINKERELPLTSFGLFLFMYLFTSDIMRHFFAAIIYLSALYSLSIDRKVNFYLKSFTSILMHYSNIIIFFIRPFLRIRWTLIKYITVTITLCIISFITKDILFDFFQTRTFTNTILIKFQEYLLYYDDAYEYSSDLHIVLKFLFQYTIVFLYFFIILFVLNHREIIRDKFYNILLSSQIIGSIILIVAIIFDANQMGLRLNFLLSIGSFLLLKEIISKKYKHKPILIYPLLIIFLSFNILVRVLYNMGVYSPSSGFYLGF